MKRLVLFLALTSLSHWTDSALADYTLILKNGRRITVQSYREEGQMIRFYGLGGEIGISKDQIQAIRRVGEEQPAGLNLPKETDPAASSPVRAPAPPEREVSPPPTAPKPLSAEEEKAKEEREYQQKLREITEQIRDARDQYSLSTRGTTTKEPTIPTEEQALTGRNDDVISRLKDSQNNPTDPGVLRMLTPSPFSTLPPTTEEIRAPAPTGQSVQTPVPYTEKQKELSDLRNRAIELETQRQRLIDEMKQKKLDSGTLFLE